MPSYSVDVERPACICCVFSISGGSSLRARKAIAFVTDAATNLLIIAVPSSATTASGDLLRGFPSLPLPLHIALQDYNVRLMDQKSGLREVE